MQYAKLLSLSCLGLFLLTAGCAHKYSIDDIKEDDTGPFLKYSDKSGKPLSGTVVDYDETDGELLISREVKNGLLDGKQRIYLGAGRVMEAEAKAGKPVGVGRVIDDKGALIGEYVYGGSFSDYVSKVYYPDGKLRLEMPFAGGKPNGLARYYGKNGELHAETAFVDGKAEGDRVLYHPSGKVRMVTPFKNSLKEGVEREYDESGKLLSASGFKNGKPVKISAKQRARYSTPPPARQ